MELKDVIHFYLGCECEYEGVLNGREMAEELKANKHDVFYIPKIQEQKGLKRGFLKLIEKYQNGRTIYRIGNKGLKAFYSTEGFKPLLRPLSDMTEEEFGVLFRLSIGTHQDHSLGDIKRMATNEVYIRQGYAQFIFGYERGYDNDVRVPQGYSFYIKRSLIKDELVVSEKGMETKESWYNNTELVIVQNQTEIFSQLLKWHFDLYNLIESSQAIATSKTK